MANNAVCTLILRNEHARLVPHDTMTISRLSLSERRRFDNRATHAVLIPRVCEPATGMITVTIADDDTMPINTIEYFGEGSGTAWPDLYELLAHVRGHLEVVIVWEADQDITILVVHDGDITKYDAELHEYAAAWLATQQESDTTDAAE